MRHGDYNGAPVGFLEQHPLELGGRGRVEASCWLVEKEDLGVVDQRPGQSNPLTLAARVRPHGAFHEGAQLESRDCTLTRRRRVTAMKARREFDISPATEIHITKGLVARPTERPSDGAPIRAQRAVVDRARGRSRQGAHDRKER
jgi:hypothetical protein